jgi:hypothetical protein
VAGFEQWIPKIVGASATRLLALAVNTFKASSRISTEWSARACEG